MKRINLPLLLIFFLSVSCASRTKIDSKKKFPSDYGFTFQVPFQGDWYQGKADYYLFGQEPERDGASILAEVRHGFIFETDGYVQVSPQTLKKIFEPSLKNKKANDKVEIISTRVFYGPFKKTACMFFKQVGFEKKSKLELNYNGMICILPSDGNKYVWMAVSQRKPPSKAFKDLTSQEKEFFNSLTFEKTAEEIEKSDKAMEDKEAEEYF